MDRAVDAAIVALSQRQQGNVTTEQLLRLGLGRSAIAYRCRTGMLFRVYRGVYAVGRPPSTPLERAAAAVLACGSRAALSHDSALTLWGLDRRWRTPLHVTVPIRRRQPGIAVHRAPRLARADVRTHLGIRVTSPARTALDCAPRLPPGRLTRLVNDARLRGLLRPDELGDVVARFSHHPGASRIIALLARSSGGPTRSEFEDAFVSFCRRFGLPAPEINAFVCGYEVDALFAAERVIVELDGWQFHQDRATFERDRTRDADTLAAGLVTVRITWERITQAAHREAQRLHVILAGRRPG